MFHWIAAHWPLVLSILALWSAMGVLLALSMHRHEGRFTYALDDAYIHMAVARNAAEHGVWGITRYEFSSTSSSPLWTALIALEYRLLGVSDFTPLVLNLLFATLALGAAYCA